MFTPLLLKNIDAIVNKAFTLSEINDLVEKLGIVPHSIIAELFKIFQVTLIEVICPNTEPSNSL